MEPHLTSSCENLLMTKKINLSEDLEKVANNALSEIKEVNEVMNDIKLHASTAKTTIIRYIDSKTQTKSTLKTRLEQEKCMNQAKDFHEDLLLKKYFSCWKHYWRHQKDILSDIDQRTKLKKLIKSIKSLNNKKTNTPRSRSSPTNNTGNSGDVGTKSIRGSQDIIQHRFSAQQWIIESLREQLDLQTKLISELKLGIVENNIMKSISSFKVDIKEIFSDKSSLNAKVQTHSLIMPKAKKRLDNFLVTSQKKPKHIKQMEERAAERQTKRELILQRKSIREKDRQLELEKSLAEKKSIQKEIRQRNLQLLKEKLRKRTEKERIRTANLEKTRRANKYYANFLLRMCLRKLKANCNESLKNFVFASQFYDNKLKEKYFYLWLSIVSIINRRKRKLAENYHNKCLQRIYLKQWHQAYKKSLKLWYTAVDFYDFMLQDKVFKKWKELIREEDRISKIKMEIAKLHDEKRIKFNYFFTWRSYPAIKKLEKAKEEKKHKWREMVLKILPNFRPRSIEN